MTKYTARSKDAAFSKRIFEQLDFTETNNKQALDDETKDSS